MLGGLDFPGLAQFLGQLGIAGAVIGYLLWENRGNRDKMEADRKAFAAELKAVQEAHMADIRKYSSDTAASLANAAAVITANTAANERAASTTNRLAEAVTAVTIRLEQLGDAVDRLDARTRS